MSLLMEALRKAEEAKRKTQNPNSGVSADFSRAPANQPDIAPSPVLTASPEFDVRPNERNTGGNARYIVDNFLLDAVDGTGTAKSESTLSTDRRKSGRASAAELQRYLEAHPELDESAPVIPNEVHLKPAVNLQEQRTAAAVFAAKQKPAQPHATRNNLLIVLVLTVAIGSAALWYVANSSGSFLSVDPALIARPTRSLSDELYAQQEAATQNPVSAITSVEDQNAVQAPASVVTITPSTAVAQEPEIAAAGNTSQAQNYPDISAAAQESAVSSARQATPDPAPAGSPAAPEDPAPTDIDPVTNARVLEVSHSAGTNRDNQQLLAAYASLQMGDLTAAATKYQAILEQLPNNRDALLGHASIAMRLGNLLQAREYYTRLMRLNPKDPLARTGLLQTVQEVDLVQYERELQRLIRQHPEVPPLSFALGNVYAGQQRWNEAQNAYFDALLFARQSDPDAVNPDYAYNLAVSLEQLNQPGAALDYYRQAQTLAEEVSPGFDRQELSRRISFLERNNP